MALHDLRITVVDGGKAKYYSGNGNNPFDFSESENITNGYNQSQDIGAGLEEKTLNIETFATVEMWNIAKNIAQGAFKYVVSDIGRQNGDSNYQALINRQLEITQDVSSVLMGVLSGAKIGASAGPAGAVVGAVIGTVGSSVNLVFKYAERGRDYKHTLFKESTSQAYLLARANYSATTGRLR